MRFEDKKFCQLRTLADRWDCSIDYLKDLASRGVIKFWHPEGKEHVKGVKVVVSSAIDAEKRGYIDIT
jgi:hypothetical protein